MKIVLASDNPGKVGELKAMVARVGVELQRQADLGVGQAAEPFRTFVENALAKARFAAAHTGLPALADDAGLRVDAFGGLPGVGTAGYPTPLRPARRPRRPARRDGRGTSPAPPPRGEKRPRASMSAAPRWSARWWPCAAPTTRSRRAPSAARSARSPPPPPPATPPGS